MAKKKPTRESEPLPSQPPKITTTKVDSDLLRMARIVADARGMNLYDYLDAILRASVKPDYRQFINDEAARPEG